MTAQTQQRILDVLNRVLAEVGDALECKVSYETGIGFLREYGKKTVATVVLEFVGKFVPGASVTPENYGAFLAAMDTREKAEALLLVMEEPDPASLNQCLSAVRGFLPTIRQGLLPFAKRLPHPPGGAPKKFRSESERREVRKKIGSLLADGVSLSDAKRRIADQKGVSVSTIARVWADRKREAPVS